MDSQLERFVGEAKHLVLVTNPEVKRFNPGEQRDDKGRWTSGGEVATADKLEKILPSYEEGSKETLVAAAELKYQNMIRTGDELLKRAESDSRLALQLDQIAADERQGIKGAISTLMAREGRTLPLEWTSRHHAAYWFSNKMQKQWAYSSFENPTSLALQLSIAQRFGTANPVYPEIPGIKDLADVMKVKWDWPPEPNKVLDNVANSPVMKHYVDAVYTETQDRLKAQGIESLSVSRGVKWQVFNKQEIPDEFKFDGDSVKAAILIHPLSSFSADKSIARSFGKPILNDDQGFVVTAEIPRERVFSMPTTGPGCADERELVLIGGTIDVTISKWSRI